MNLKAGAYITPVTPGQRLRWYNRVLSGDRLEFVWDDSNREHLARHGISSTEAVEVIVDPHALILEIQTGPHEERTKALGTTATGRILVIVFTFRGDAIGPITGYPARAR